MCLEIHYLSRLSNYHLCNLSIAFEQGTSKVEAICLEGYQLTEEEECLTDEMFKNLPRLRILELAGAKLEGNFQRLFSQLRWLSWHAQSTSLPANLHLKKLIVLNLSKSLIQADWIGWNSIEVLPITFS